MKTRRGPLRFKKKFKNSDETGFLLPLSIIHYKKQQHDKAEEYLRRLQEVNSDTKKFICKVINGEGIEEILENM